MDESPRATITAHDLPMTFQVKYLGSRPAKGLWGIRHTRRPINDLVEAAKALPKDKVLPFVRVEVTIEGLNFREIGDKKSKDQVHSFKVDTISYGVQDLVYTRVFCMIVVNDEDIKDGHPFICHAFACDSKNQARQVTYALAAAFEAYGQKVKQETGSIAKKRFAIDLRTPQQMENDEDEEDETEA